MKVSLQSFLNGLADLRHYIQGLVIELELLSTLVESNTPSPAESILVRLQAHAPRPNSQWRVFNYNSIIISLYGFFEQFVESLLMAYINDLNEVVPRYQQLPESITKSHTELSFELIRNIEHPRYRGVLTEAQIISNLHTCVNNGDRYRINAEAFTHHTANFRTDVIQESFTHVGVENVSRHILEASAFVDYLKEIDPDLELSRIRQDNNLRKNAFFYLNDLAKRRNEVAHGASSGTLNNDDIRRDYITFFEAYGRALYEVVYESTLPHLVQHRAIELGTPIDVFNNKIVCISVKNTTVRVGDLLIAQTADTARPYLAGEIQKLQVENIPYKEVPADPDGVDIGMCVLFNAKENQSFFVVPKPV
jgi:hypothetical protein